MKNLSDIESLKQTILQYRDKRVMITFHSVGDADALSSAFLVARFFPNHIIVTPDRITSNARRMLHNSGENPEAISNSFDKSAELIVMVDVNNFEGCEPLTSQLEKTSSTILIIDHHSPTTIEKENVLSFNDESHNSAASIVMDLLESARLQINSNEARMLLTGIISDSAEFKNSTPKTFMQVGKLLQIGKTTYPSIVEQMFIEPDPKSRAESAEDLFSSRMEVKSGLLFMYGRSKGPANIPADHAIRIGADVSIFINESASEVSISSRLRPPLDRKYGIHLGKVMRSLAPLIKGTGGGHPCAAGAYGGFKDGGPKFLDEFIHRILESAR
jgi:bifunctional oligoribonuclease and PAP phosphatase NrnA